MTGLRVYFAMSIRPELVRHITPANMNIVFQRLAGNDPNPKFDLIIGTNIFIYYGAFEQSRRAPTPQPCSSPADSCSPTFWQTRCPRS